MRHIVLILFLLCGSFFSYFVQAQSPSQEINIEKIEVKFIDVSNDPAGNVGTECTTNPADHTMAARIMIPVSGNGSDSYIIQARNKGEIWDIRDGLSNKRKKAGQIDVTWTCSYYNANPDNQVAYEMVSC